MRLQAQLAEERGRRSAVEAEVAEAREAAKRHRLARVGIRAHARGLKASELARGVTFQRSSKSFIRCMRVQSQLAEERGRRSALETDIVEARETHRRAQAGMRREVERMQERLHAAEVAAEEFEKRASDLQAQLQACNLHPLKIPQGRAHQQCCKCVPLLIMLLRLCSACVAQHALRTLSGSSNGNLTTQATEARLKQSERGVGELQAALEAAQQDAVEAATSASCADKELRTQQSMSAQHQRLLRQPTLALSLAFASNWPALKCAVREGAAANRLPMLACWLLMEMRAQLHEPC